MFYSLPIVPRFNIVSLSGTSGGAICAFFTWYALKKGDSVVWKRMIDFWEDNSARTPQEQLFNDSAIKALELASKGLIPQYNLSPSSPITKTLFSLATYGLRGRFTNFDQLLRAHIDFSELATWGAKPEPPVLLIGACNILTGKLSKFNSRQEAVTIEHILASAMHVPPAPNDCNSDKLYCTDSGSLVSFSPLMLLKYTRNTESTSMTSGECPHISCGTLAVG